MKINEVHIYGFGKLSNVKLNFSSTIQVIYGVNEAGKSTLMAFIHGILFGFPTKQQSEIRYEPKMGTKYGGYITIESNSGEVWIERVKGKATGYVTVRLEDGTQGGEELLKDLLKNMDKALFKSIFSFNIHGIQGVSQLKGEDIGTYLIAAGTIGTDAIVKSEQKLQKELDRLFKPSGRKPELNEMLQTIKDQEKELKKSMQYNQTYEKLQLDYQHLVQDISELKGKISASQADIQRLEQLKRDWGLLQERKDILQSLNNIGDITFPIDGLKRMEKLEDQLQVAANQLYVIDVRKGEYEKELTRLLPNKLIAEHEENIQLLIEKWPQIIKWQEEIIRREEEITKWNEQIAVIKRELHIHDMSNLSFLDLSIDMKERIRTVTKDYYYLKSSQIELDKQLENENRRFQELENQCVNLESALLNEDEYRELSESQQKYISLQNDYKHLQDQVKFINLSKGSKQKDNYLPTILFYLLFIGFFVWSVTTHQFVYMTGALIGIIILSFSSWINHKKMSEHNMNQENHVLVKAEKILAEMNQIGDKGTLYDEQQKLRQRWKGLVLEIENQQIRCQEKEQNITVWKRNWKMAEEALGRIKEQLGLQKDFSPENLSDAFELLNELAILDNQLNRSESQKSELLNKVANWECELKNQLSSLQFDGLSNEEGIIRLKNSLLKERENKLIYREIINKNEDVENEYLKWKNEYIAIETAINNLLHEVEVENTEDFRRRGKEYEEYQSLQANLKMINKKINIENMNMVNQFAYLNDLEEKLLINENSLKSNNEKLELLHKRLAEVKYEIEQLEEGGTFTEKLHEFYRSKSIFNDKAKEWAKIALAKKIIHRTMERMKNERFPKVLEKAEEFLSYLTDGEYIRLLFTPTGRFLVERVDQLSFEPDELSQATAEQVYVSLRLALVEVLQDEYPFPLIIDDGFVNFDNERTKRIVQLLLERSQNTQIIYFTCHQHILQLFPQKNIFVLNEEYRYSMLK
ncbi:ATP-binding protein [Heyndrickxia vini]|uniref:AAA family ATPase n=1 Tax=Heyndrickxia vini TaxID=1476025 RepID=A0ABX7DYC8_9BACI|nr:AAA family ATPase [Heyndrickxia vini]QQZ08312.1 AAA family ATPase [Heyndrickxia vini]